MTTIRIVPAVSMIISLLIAAEGRAQSAFPLAIQFGVGVEVPVGEFADVASNGTGISIGTGVQLVPNVALYAGYSRIRFDSTAFGGDLTDSGFSAGVSFVVPVGSPRVLPWVGAGGVLHGVEISGASSQPATDGIQGWDSAPVCWFR
jgi:hypothetical protein